MVTLEPPASNVDEFDRDLRLQVYRFFLESGRPPYAAESAAALSVTPAEVEAGLRRLHDAHVIVLAPGTSYVWLANPLSALPTAFVATVDGHERYAPCVWDALGIVAMLGGNGEVSTLCPDCGKGLRLEVSDGSLRPVDYVVHYVVPARRWWDDIGFT